jgi:alpha-ribazole phosphatase
MGKIFLIRHGEVTWNKQACYTGWTDLALTEKGVSQAERLAERLKSERLDAVYCSDLERSRVTAEVIASLHGLTPIVDPDLRELNYGKWEGVAEADLPRQYPALYQDWVTNPAGISVPDGESFSQLLNRASRSFEAIMAERPDGRIAVVAHKSVNRIMLCHWLGVDINLYKRIGQDNAAINIISFQPDRVIVETLNDTCHLSGGLVTGEI